MKCWKVSLKNYKVIIQKHFKFLGLMCIVNESGERLYCRLPHGTRGQIVQKVGP